MTLGWSAAHNTMPFAQVVSDVGLEPTRYYYFAAVSKTAMSAYSNNPTDKKKAREFTSLAITNQLPLYFAHLPWQSGHTLHKWGTTSSYTQDESSILVQLPL